MVSFWQLSGPDSHFSRIWKAPPGEPIGNEKIALQVFDCMSRKLEDSDGEKLIDLVLGIVLSGASHILVTDETTLPGLSWKHKDHYPYPASGFASLSPIRVGRSAFKTLLEERQVVSKSTAASKNKGDNSKANQVFWDGPPRPARAAFEHGRCFWRILHRELKPQTYGLPNSPWSTGLDIVSLAMNFWSADGSTFLDAGITCLHVPTSSGSNPDELYTRYLKSKDCEVLRNPSQSMATFHIPETWDTEEINENEKSCIGMKIKKILESHSHPNNFPPAPLILLVHDYVSVKASLETLGIQTSTWKYELKELLGYHILDSRSFAFLDKTYSGGMKSDPRHSRDRSRSPSRTGSSNEQFSRRMRSPVQVESYAPVYVVDTMVMFQAVTGLGNHRSTIRPVDIFNKITCSDEPNYACGGSDSNYIMQSWRTMVTGASIDEQKAFYENSSVTLPNEQDSGPEAISDTGDASLFNVAEPGDLFNEGSDSDDDDDYHVYH